MDLQALNEKLADFPYVSGYTASQADVEQLKQLPAEVDKKYVHVHRWSKHMASFTEAEKKAFPGAPAAAAAKAGPSGGDDDLDLFGSDDDEEAEKAKAERAKQMEAQKKGGKPGVVAKSSIALDIKVWDDETDLKAIEQTVRSIEKEGLLWGSSQLIPVAFGMNKLRIVCVVEDEKVSVDWLTDKIEELELVQSTDIAAFQKI
uniref:Elongation factor 1-beta n=1 Tax=Aceria tosichella TaxID=561515 RepID=A0A6G1SFC4_9ACAR